jgi:SAM-dependent methyltransferase
MTTPPDLTGYKFPAPPGSAGEFTWDGRQFANRAGEQQTVLCYTRAESNWSDDLTGLHEREAGSHHPIDQASRDLAIQSIRRFCLSDAPVVLEAGCSSGFFIEALAARMPRARVIGSDYLEPPLRKLAARLPDVPLLQFDLRRCPLPDATVDAVVCLNVLEHIDDHAAAMRHLFRVLRPGGVAHLEVPAGPRLYDVYDELLMHHRRYRMSELKALAAGAGFQVLEATHLGAFVFPAFALQKLRNRRRLRDTPEAKQRLVASQIRATSKSGVLGAVFRLELSLGRWIRYPCGIRCIAALRKPRTGN